MSTLRVIKVGRSSHPLYLRYGLAVAAVAVTLPLRLVLNPYIGSRSPYISFFIAVVFSSWFGGLGPGILATFLSAAVAWYTISFHPDPGEWIVILLFFSQGILLSYLLEWMAASKQRIDSIVESVSDGFAVFDPQWRILYVNENGAAMVGVRVRELIGANLWQLFPRAVGTEFWQKLHEAMRERKPIHFEYYNDEQQRWFEYSGYPALEGLTLYTRDITERKNARTELESAKAQIELMNVELEQRVQERTAQLNATIKELEAFSYSISHDLRAPLRAIDGFSRMLDEDYNSKLDSEGRRIIEVIRKSTVKMGYLIDGLLAFSRLGRQPMGSSETDLTELARDAFNEINVTGESRQIRFTISDLPPAIGDRVLLRQVFVNLLSNALKFTRDRDPAIIEVGSRIDTGQNQDENVFYVIDNGVGFDMRYVDKLFGVFQRLHAANEFEGTGLGLAIVQRIVHRHGGRVWAEAALGQGATIYFSLPRVKSGETRRTA